MSGAYAFEYDDMESDYWDGSGDLEAAIAAEAYAAAGLSLPWHDTCATEGCDDYPNKWGVCPEHSKAVPPPGAKTGTTGVFNRGGKYAARLAHKGTEFHLGTFPTIADAAEAIAAKKSNAPRQPYCTHEPASTDGFKEWAAP